MTEKSTLAQAEAARERHADGLAGLGAHAVGVELADDGWVVVAHVAPGALINMPAKLAATVAGKAIDVPLKILRSEIAKPE